MQAGDFSAVNKKSVNLILSPSALAKKTFFYPLQIGYLEMSPSQYFTFNKSDCYLLLYIGYGNGLLIHNEKKLNLEKNNLLFLKCGKEHEYYAQDELRILYIYFNGKQTKAYYDMIKKYRLNIVKIKNSKTLMSLFWQIIALHKKMDSHAEHLTSFHITRILTEICLLKNNDYISDFEYPEYINDIFHRIDHFYNKKYTLDKLAKLYSINKFHLAREFKKYSGTTLNEYLITTRIDRAKQFLRYSKKSIEQIAQEVGFYNSSHFIKMFHTREHITPLSYRKQWTCSIS